MGLLPVFCRFYQGNRDFMSHLCGSIFAVTTLDKAGYRSPAIVTEICQDG